ncbi:uncharacterized protein LOC124698653 [Lolium rigidum]|uniref:uncharacterized protein LOC124698653 n=1 Tax=Lolium rigidum TaxID=89674 RepID=UPI001F5CCBC2|nr:uncharacterized protein LOC124698653 [Lolium rigidum]
MQKQNLAISFCLPLSDQKNKNPSMTSKDTVPQCRRDGGDDDANNSGSDSEAPDDFEFCIPSSGGLVPDGVDAADMCVAGEVFSGGKLLPLRLSSATAADVSALLLLRSDSLDGATTVASTSDFSSRSDSRSASSSSSSSSVSRSASSKSASSESISQSHSSKSASSDAVAPRRRSVTNSLFYGHPSPSPRPPRRTGGSMATSAARRSTGSAPPAAWGVNVIRLGVVGAPEVYAPRETESRKVGRGGSRSARFEQPRPAGKEPVTAVDKKLALGLLGAGLVCSCSADAVEPVSSREAASAAARRRRRNKAEETKKGDVKSGRGTVRRSRILEWLEELSIAKPKNFVQK